MNSTIDELLKEALSVGVIGMDKSESMERHHAYNRMVDLGLINENGNSARLTDQGHRVIEIGGFNKWQVRLNTNEGLLLKYIDKLLLKFPDYESFDTENVINELEIELNKVGEIQPLLDELISKLVELKYIVETETYDSLSEFGRMVKEKGGHFKYQDFLIKEDNRAKKAPRNSWLQNTSWVFGIIVAIIIIYEFVIKNHFLN